MADEPNDRALTAIAATLEGCPTAAFKARLRRSLERSIAMMIGTAPQVRGARPGFTTVTPYLITQDVDRLIAFAKEVFGAEETHRSTGAVGGTHCELRIGDSMLMLGGGISALPDGRPLRPRLMGLHVYVDDADAVFERALAAGAESMGAPADRPYGERAGFVRDPAGNQWYIATHRGPTYFAQDPRTVTPNVGVPRTDSGGAAEFIAFVETAFEGRVELRDDTPAGTVAHAVLRIRDAAIEIGEAGGFDFAAPASFYLYVDDCDALYARAIAAGAMSLHAPADQPYGDRVGGVTDPWGNEWFIATHLARE
jgi:PhnB protein